MEISLIHVNISYQRVTPTQLLELFLCLQFLKNNQPKIILLPKRHIFEVANLLSYISPEIVHKSQVVTLFLLLFFLSLSWKLKTSIGLLLEDCVLSIVGAQGKLLQRFHNDISITLN